MASNHDFRNPLFALSAANNEALRRSASLVHLVPMPQVHDLPVVLTPDEDGGFVVECSAIPGCISQGDTRDEALANIREAIELCLESQTAEG